MLTINISDDTLMSIINMNDRDDIKMEVLPGTLDLMVLQTLETLGPLHGYGIAQRIQQVSSDLLELNQGTLYPALLRLEQRRWVSSKWRTTDNNRRARFYTLTPRGREQLKSETQMWNRTVALMNRLLSGER
jgi:PadR family transcriptional regulator, regulatory protein PadR